MAKRRVKRQPQSEPVPDEQKELVYLLFPGLQRLAGLLNPKPTGLGPNKARRAQLRKKRRK